MLHFVLGTKGAGKTTRLHRILARYVKEENAEALLIVPRQFTFESDRGILQALGPKDACQVQVLSFSRLADLTFKTTGKPKRPLLKAGANTAVMLLALDAVRDRLAFFTRHADSYAFAKKMLAAVAQFKQSCVSPGDLSAAAAHTDSAFLRAKLQDTALIYETYNAMVAQSFFDDQDVLTLAAEKLPQSGVFRDKIIVVDNFAAFSAQELELLRLMLQQGREVYVSLCTDALANTDAMSAFALTNRTARRLRRLAAQCGVPVAPEEIVTDFAPAAAALRHLAQHFNDPLQPTFVGAAPALTFCSAPSLWEECDFAALQIHRLLRTGAYRCRDIAVVFRNAEVYGDEIRHSFQKFGVPVFEDHRAPVANEPLMILARALLSMRVNGFSTEELMRYLKTGLSGLTWDEIARAENYALLWDISGAKWQGPWTDNPDGFGEKMTDARRQVLEELNDIRARVMTPLTAFRAAAKEQGAKDVMTLLYRFLTENGVDEALKAYALSLEDAGEVELALAQGQVWDCLMQVLDDVAQTLCDRVVSPKLLLDVFDGAVAEQSLGKLPDGYDEVTLCDVSRITTQTPKVVFVLGVNEGVFPQPPQENGLFSHHETAALRAELPALLDEEERRTMTERFWVYNALCAAREKLIVSWTLAGSTGEKTEPSALVTQLQKLFPAAATLQYDALDVQTLCEAKQPAFELTAKLFCAETPQAQALRSYFFADDAYRARMQTLSRAVERRPFAFDDPQKAKALFGERMSVSASQLEKYEECPFQYFCRYGLRAKPRQIAKLDPANSGTIVHFVLEHLMQQHSGSAFKSLPKETAQAEIRVLLKNYIDTYMGGTEGKSKRFLYLYARLEKTLVTIVERLLKEFRGSGFAPIGFEVQIGGSGEVRPYVVPLKDGEVALRGVIDRVDQMRRDGKNYIRVVDYKTGTKAFELSDVLGGLSMQMLLYLVALWRDGSGDYEEMIPAGVLYLPARAEPFDGVRGDSPEETTNRRLAGGKMEGMVLDDATVIDGMAGGDFTFLPLHENKRSSTVGGSVISLAQLGKLARRMDRIMADMGNSLHAGKVPAVPVRGKTHSRTCEWCDYATVCQREHGDAFRLLPLRTHEACLKELDEEG